MEQLNFSLRLSHTMRITASIIETPYNCWLPQQSEQSNGMSINTIVPAWITSIGNFDHSHHESIKSAQSNDCCYNRRMDQRLRWISRWPTMERSGWCQWSFSAYVRRNRSHSFCNDESRIGRLTSWNPGQRRCGKTKNLFPLFANQIYHIRTVGREM